MNRNHVALAILASAGLCASVNAQVFQFQRAENFFSLAGEGAAGPPVVPNPFFVNRPASIETDGTSLNWFIGGIALTSSARQPWQVSVVKVEFPDAQGSSRAFRTIPVTRQGQVVNSNFPTSDPAVSIGPGAGSSRGWHSLDTYVKQTPTELTMLAMGMDSGVNGTPLVRVLDIGTQLNPISIGVDPGTSGGTENTNRLAGGVAWDSGPDAANGNPQSPPHIGTTPLLAGMHFGDAGPRGMSRTSPNPRTALSYYFGRNIAGALGSSITPYSYPIVPGTYNTSVSPKIPDTGNTSNTQWRHIDIHPTNGLVVARANNVLRITNRDVDNTQTNAGIPAGDQVSILPPNGLIDNLVGGSCKIITGFPGGDLVIWNDRPGVATPNMFNNILFNRLNGFTAATPFPAVTVPWKNADATDFAQPTGDSLFDFAWIPSEKRLLVMAALVTAPAAESNGTVYVFDLVSVAASIVTPPASQTVASGSNATFSVTAAGDAVRYEWRKDGTPVVDGGTLAGQGTATLTITGVVAGDAGGYSVRVFNALGSATSGDATLTIGGGGPTACNPADIADNGSNPGADGCVDNGDFSLFISQFFNPAIQAGCAGAPIPCAAADIADNGSNAGADGFLDNGDFSLFISSFFGADCTATCLP
jgi:hypothetical protein